MDLTTTLVDISLRNMGTGESCTFRTTLDYDKHGVWDYRPFADGQLSCDCVRSSMLYEKNKLYDLPCNIGPNIIIIENISLSNIPNSTFYKEELVEGEDKQKKILKEIDDLAPYLSELQEYKEKGLFLPEGTTDENKSQPIYDGQGNRIDSASKKKRQTKEEIRRELNAKAFKLRILVINKWLDDQFSGLLPKWAIKSIRRWPQYRHVILKLFFVKVSIAHKDRPVPFGSDKVEIRCLFAMYSEVNFVWQK